MTNSISTCLPDRKVYYANFPMNDHICRGRRYRLCQRDDTGRERGRRTVFSYVFDLVEDDESSQAES